LTDPLKGAFARRALPTLLRIPPSFGDAGTKQSKSAELFRGQYLAKFEFALKANAGDLGLSLLELLETCLNQRFVQRVAVDRHIEGSVRLTQPMLGRFHCGLSVPVHHPYLPDLVLSKPKVLEQVRPALGTLKFRILRQRRRAVLRKRTE
jgi:hypothetical protein